MACVMWVAGMYMIVDLALRETHNDIVKKMELARGCHLAQDIAQYYNVR